jgi:hypothetical protein
MGGCSKCGKEETLPFTCKFCREEFCTEHRLPEDHDCVGLAMYKENGIKSMEYFYDADSGEMVGDSGSGSKVRQILGDWVVIGSLLVILLFVVLFVFAMGS